MRRDYGSKITDKAVAQSLKKIQRVYAQAEKELNQKLLSFRKHFAKRQKELIADLEAGNISKAEYESRMRGQVFTGERWKKKVEQAAGIFGQATRAAHKIIQKIRLWVFSENYNRYAYETEIKTGISFDIYNEDAVDKLLTENPKMLPEYNINEEKDYIWNRQKVENAITQGIIQGESVDQIAERLARDLKTGNMNKMRMFARTALTGAQNAGRQKQMEDALERGIDIRKQWIATLDDRTRDTHRHLDGQIVGVKESFRIGTKDGTETIRYPGDPNAAPALVYNCRCTMKSVFKGLENKGQRRAYRYNEEGYRESYIVQNMTYDEWKKWKEGQK